MKTICVIESAADFRAVSKHKGEVPHDTIYYCSCPETALKLSKAGIRFVSLTDDILSSQWDEINQWARKASLTWFRDPKVSNLLTFNGLNLGDVYNRRLSHALIYRLKNRLLADYLLSHETFERILIFDQYVKKGSKKSKDEGTINDVLAQRFRGKGKVMIHIFSFIKTNQPSFFKETFRKMISFLYTMFRTPKEKAGYAGMGTLKHLLPVLSRFNFQNQAAFIDEEFHRRDFEDCARNGITYVLAESLISWKQRLTLAWEVSKFKKQIPKISSLVHQLECFKYRGNLLVSASNAVKEVFSSNLYPRLRQASLSEVLKKRQTKVLLLHEDVDAFRAAALAAKKNSLPAAVLSHGIPPTPGDWSEAASGIGVAETLVNSEFEKEKYIHTGYEPAQIHIIGLPRYDLIYKKRLEHKDETKKRKKVLYCPHMLTRQTKRKKGYLGIHTSGAATRQNSIEVMKASQAAGCGLLIKPHANSQDLKLWKELVQEFGGETTMLVSHQADIFDLIASSDLVIATFSTVVIEAMLFNKDVITINFTGRPDIHPYAERGIAMGVYKPEDLAEAIGKCLSGPAVKKTLKQAREKEMKYFGGRFDGRNTERAVDFLRLLGEGKAPKKSHERNLEPTHA